MYSALWVQLALVVCYIPFIVVEIVIVEADSKTFSSHLLVTRRMAATLLYSNSSLKLFLYCWKINEARQALCCPCNSIFLDEGIILFAASKLKIQSLGSLYEIEINMIVNHFVARAFFKFSISN